MVMNHQSADKMTPDATFRTKPCDVCRRLMSSTHFVSASVCNLIKILPTGTKIEHARCPSGYLPPPNIIDNRLFLCATCRKRAVHKAFSAATDSKDSREPPSSPVSTTAPCAVCYRRMPSNAILSGFEENFLSHIPERIYIRSIVQRDCFWPWSPCAKNQISLCRWCKVCAMRKAAYFLVEQRRVQSSRHKGRPSGIIEKDVLLSGNADHNEKLQFVDLMRSKPSRRQKILGSRRYSKYGLTVGPYRNKRPAQTAINKSVRYPKKCCALKTDPQKSQSSIEMIDLTWHNIDSGSASMENENAQSTRRWRSDEPLLPKSETKNPVVRKPAAIVEKVKQVNDHQNRTKLELERLRVERQRTRLERERIVLEYKYKAKKLDERVQRIKADMDMWRRVEKLFGKEDLKK